ncbi:ATP-binding protein [Paracoccaceae bacterium Fryx2]|nr:ATP-binding protein [Paracoccaceae bacterium Fryx2]
MIERLHDLVERNAGWLTARIIHHAKERGYLPLTSTLEQAWAAAICGISEPLLGAIEGGGVLLATAAEADHSRDPIIAYGMEIARRHQSRGITLGLFLGQMKGYRQTYLDLVAEAANLSEEERASFPAMIHTFFDRIEVGICDEWISWSPDGQAGELAAQNQRLMTEKNKYLTIFESLSDPVILLTEAGVVENMNHAAARLFIPDPVPGATYYGATHPTLAGLLGAAAASDLAAHAEAPGERQLDTLLGPRWFGIKTQRMLDISERFLGSVMILTDVTEYRRAKEAAEASSRAKSTFLATMGHEIRTPIHGIIGLADLMNQSGVTPDLQGYAAAIARCGEALAAVVTDILDFSRMEAGRIDVESVPFSVAAVVEDVFDLMQPIAAQNPDLRLVLERPDLPPMIGDPGKLRQILLNLVGNAVKFTEEGTVWLTIDTVSTPGQPVSIRFVVADTGIGIAPERLEAVFEAFTQGDSSVSRRFGGSGLGLAICRRLADRLGGSLAVESRLGAGSRFTLSLPCQPVDGVVRTAPAPAAPGLPVRALNILVVEDNAVNALVARGLLERMGHSPLVVGTGSAALAEVATGVHDLVLLDLRLPDMDGLETARRIRALAADQGGRVPVVALSAHAQSAEIEGCLAAGMDDFLGKPFRADRLEQVLRRVLGVSSPHPGSPPALPGPPAQAGGEIARDVLLTHVAALGTDHAAQIVAAFQDSTATLPDDLDRLAASQARAEIAELAHRLKGASLQVGLMLLSQRAAVVEAAARNGTGGAGFAAQVGDLATALRRSAVLLDLTWADIVAGQPADIQPANM